MTDVWGEDRPTRRQLAFDVVTALVFAAVMLLVHVGLGLTAPVAVVLLAAALAVRRLSWQAMSLLGFAAAVTQVAGDTIAYLANTAYAVLFLTLGAHQDGRVRRFGLVAAGVAVTVAALFGATRGWPDLAAPDVREPGTSLVERLTTAVALGSSAAVFCLGGWAWGYLRWQQRQSVQARVDARVEAVERARIADLFEVEQERRRIAADMHDVVAHSWAVVAAQSDGARYACGTTRLARSRRSRSLVRRPGPRWPTCARSSPSSATPTCSPARRGAHSRTSCSNACGRRGWRSSSPRAAPRTSRRSSR